MFRFRHTEIQIPAPNELANRVYALRMKLALRLRIKLALRLRLKLAEMNVPFRKGLQKVHNNEEVAQIL